MPEVFSSGTLRVEPSSGPIRYGNIVRRDAPNNGTRFSPGRYYLVMDAGLNNRYYCREVRSFRDGFRFVPGTGVIYFTNPGLFQVLTAPSIDHLMRASPTLEQFNARYRPASRYSPKVWPPASKRVRYQHMREEIV